MSRISALEHLRDGWSGPGTVAPQPALVEWVRRHAMDIAAAPLVTSVIPLGDGEISLVWGSPDREFTAELHADRVVFYVDHLDSDLIEERTLPLDWQAILTAMRSEIA